MWNWIRWTYRLRYWRSQTPWDTNITPPEVIAFLESSEPGRAIDIGCGTGTNAIKMARFGWRVTGVDFVPSAIRKARRKARKAGLSIDFRLADATDLKDIDGPFEYALDIGCLFSIDEPGQGRYASGLARLVNSGGNYMLYAWLPRVRQGKRYGLAQNDVEDLFTPAFTLDRTEIGEERGGGSAWYWLTRN